MTLEEQLHEKVLMRMDLSREMSDLELQDLIYAVIEEEGQCGYISLKEKVYYGKQLFDSFRGLDQIQDILEDESVTEIMINGVDNIFIETQGRLCRMPGHFTSRARLEDVIQQIVSASNRQVNESRPIADAILPDGSRVNVVLPPVAINGPIVTIRKFPKEVITMPQLVAWDALDGETAGFLKLLIQAKYNLFISGGTGSGKTTFLNALAGYIPKDERIVTIEDNAELQIKTIPNLIRLEAREVNMEGEGAITIRDLIKSSLRMRPDRIIVGEVRSGECLDMLQAMNSGHSGSLSTGHSNSPRDTLHRLETMVLMGMDLPLAAVQRQIASAIDVIIHLGRLRDKSRRVLEIVEVLGYEDGEIKLQTLYTFEEQGEENGKLQGTLAKKAALARRDKLLAAGYQ